MFLGQDCLHALIGTHSTVYLTHANVFGEDEGYWCIHRMAPNIVLDPVLPVCSCRSCNTVHPATPSPCSKAFRLIGLPDSCWHNPDWSQSTPELNEAGSDILASVIADASLHLQMHSIGDISMDRAQNRDSCYT